MTKSIDLLRRELHAFCELAQRRGWRLTPHVWREEATKECCVLAAIGIVVGPRCAYRNLFDSSDDFTVFWKAFDGAPYFQGPYADLGREFRLHYVGGEK